MKNFSIIIIVFFNPILLAQDSLIYETGELIEEIIEESDEETDNAELYELVENLIENPLDINSASISELQVIPFLDFTSAKKIVEHRNKYGHFFSVNELYLIKDLDKKKVNEILPFFFVKKENEKSSTNKNFFSNTALLFRSRLVNDLQEREGFKNGNYAGNSYKIYNRFKIKYSKKIEAGFLAEKDPGEKNFNEFSSFHLSIKDISFLKKFVAGDYVLEFGQGLALWSPYGFSKSSDAILSIKKRGRGIKGYTSTNENQFFRGAAGSILLNDFLISAFYSGNKFDAGIETFTDEIVSVPVDGYHRTENELLRKKTGSETIFGADIEYLSDNFSAGILYHKSSFNKSFQPSGRYDISGKYFNYYSFYFDLVTTPLNFFGEVSYNGNSAALLIGAHFSVTKNFSFITLFRNYPENYINLHGYGFGERSGATQNETGFYSGFRFKTGFGTLNFYFDQFKFPFSSFNSILPSKGNEILLSYNHIPWKRFEIKLRYKNETKEVETIKSDSKIISDRFRQNFKNEFIYNVTRSFRLKFRFDYNTFKIDNAFEDGYLVFQDFRLIPVKKLNVFARIIFFKTDSFNSAVYEYENDLTGIFSGFALFGEGLRWYCSLGYKVTDYFNISFKYAETYKPLEKSLGTGNSRINGNLDNRLGFQLDIKL